MTQDEIIRSPLGREQLVALAREAGFDFDEPLYLAYASDLERFAALVAAAERKHIESNQDLTIAHMVGFEKGKDYMKEKAAKVCESEKFAVWETAERIAAAIRSMK